MIVKEDSAPPAGVDTHRAHDSTAADAPPSFSATDDTHATPQAHGLEHPVTETHEELPPSYAGSVTPATRSLIDDIQHRRATAKHRWSTPDWYMELFSYARGAEGGAANVAQPLLVAGAPIHGTLTTQYKHKETFKEVSLQIVGMISRSTVPGVKTINDPVFWQVEKQILEPGTTISGSSHTFPFSFEVPRACFPYSQHRLEDDKEAHLLPPTIMLNERDVPYTVQYKLILRMRRKGIMKTYTDFEASCRLHQPSKASTSPSPTLLSAYRLQVPFPPAFPGSEDFAMTESRIQIRAFDRADFGVQCQMFLPKPLAYVIEGYIPFHLRFILHEGRADARSSSNIFSSISPALKPSQAGEAGSADPASVLDVLFSSGAYKAVLHRKAVVGPNAELAMSRPIAESRAFWKNKVLKKGEKTMEGITECEGLGEVWVTGQIQAIGTYTPSFRMPYVGMEYALGVELEATGIRNITATKKSAAVVAAPIVLTSSPRNDDPIPPSQAPAASDGSVAPPTVAIKVDPLHYAANLIPLLAWPC